MVFVPAVAVGGFVVFAVGWVILYAALEAIIRWRKRFAPTNWDVFIKNNQEKLSLIGGVIAVLILLRLLITSEWRPLLWIGLMGLGILVGIFTFVIGGSSAKTQTKGNDRPPGSYEAPRRGEESLQTAWLKGSAAQTRESIPAAGANPCISSYGWGPLPGPDGKGDVRPESG